MSIKLIGSPKHRILPGDVLLSEVNLLAISVETFLPISAPKPVNEPPSGYPVAESADALVANPPAIPAAIIFFLTIDLPTLPKRLPKLLDTVGAPKVLD